VVDTAEPGEAGGNGYVPISLQLKDYTAQSNARERKVLLLEIL
jgi:hypothetical protein